MAATRIAGTTLDNLLRPSPLRCTDPRRGHAEGAGGELHGRLAPPVARRSAARCSASTASPGSSTTSATRRPATGRRCSTGWRTTSAAMLTGEPIHPLLRRLAPSRARARLPRARVPAPDRREPAGSGGVPLRDLRRAGRLLRPVGEPGRASSCCTCSARPRPSASRCRTRSARASSSPSTGRTWARTTGAAASTCRRRTSSASASRRTSWRRERPERAPAGAARLRGRARPAAARSRASSSSARCAGRARLAVAGYVGGGRAAFDAIESSGYDVLGARRRRRAPRAAKATVDVLLEAR